ncbi:MAG: bifunctional chorismate mutase/prephenate dehydratase [Oscillospiraceae bacterium]|nr:bifunctional chorismate mutase/prephenate dehydratase [Oscillospiraceae bacterium]
MSEYRNKLDSIDEEILRLFSERMNIAAEIASWKQENSLPVLDVRREKEKLQRIEEMSDPELSDYTFTLFSMLMELSRSRQNRILHRESPETRAIEEALRDTPQLFPEKAIVACQGVEGAYSGIACEKLFARPSIFYFSSFDAVFTAVEKGLCRYGVIPVENSTAGTVNAVYDLMVKHDFRIVRSVRIKVDHNLLVRPGTRAEDITEIYSHGQALTQCAGFLQRFPNAKIIPCENTAVAAKMVAESADPGVAALSSRSCAKLYGLEILMASVQDSDNNYTRFICISKNLEIYPGADHTSLMMVIRDEPGTLHHVLARFYVLGINMHKLESRPIPGRNWEYRFYFDLDTSVYSPKFIQLMGELGDICEEYEYLGSYSEVV